MNSFIENLIYNDGYYITSNQKEIKDYYDILNEEFENLGLKISSINDQMYKLAIK